MAVKPFYIDEEDLIDFQLYGIASAYSDEAYFVYHLNRIFYTGFTRWEKDLDILIENQLTYYPVFEWEDIQEGVVYTLIKNIGYNLNTGNKAEDLLSLFEVIPPLISKFKEYNYLLRISGEEIWEFPISENNFIQKVVKLDLNNIKSIENLIF